MQARQITFDAFSNAWETQKKHIGIYAVGLLIWLLITWAIALPVSLVFQGMMQASLANVPPEQLMMATFTSPMYIMSQLVQQLIGALVAPIGIGIANMALQSMRGQTPTLSMMFDFKGRYMNLVVYCLVLAIIGSIGMVFCFIPGLIVYGLLLPGGLLVLEDGMQPLEAIKKCFTELTPSLGSLLAIVLVCGLMAILGAFLCGIGFLFLGPVYFCCQASVYRMAGYDKMENGGGDAGFMPTEYYRPS